MSEVAARFRAKPGFAILVASPLPVEIMRSTLLFR